MMMKAENTTQKLDNIEKLILQVSADLKKTKEELSAEIEKTKDELREELGGDIEYLATSINNNFYTKTEVDDVILALKDANDLQ